jgi:membrane protein implicated in regulation of membrane protease activity
MPSIECDACGEPFDATPDASGKATCPRCGDVVRVQASGPPTSQPAATPPASRAIADEKELLVVSPALFRGHPFVYSGLILLAFGGLVVTVLPLFTLVGWPLSLAGLFVIIVAVVGFLKLFVFSHRWYRLRITDRRSVDERGIITRRHSEVLHSHAVNIRIQQNVWQRFMNLGDFEIESAAGGSVDPESGRTSTEISIKDIPDPYGVKALIDKHRGR